MLILKDVSNPVPRVKHPEWLHKELLQRNDSFKQLKMTDHFKLKKTMTTEEYNAEQKENTPPDIEDLGNKNGKQQKITNLGRKRTRQENVLNFFLYKICYHQVKN